ncbi:MAG TPA: hypothetical protein VFU21_28215 [Kofleriaceae bacterium]|nr:hypothetical protein [Kofleriaceae bacterium]
MPGSAARLISLLALAVALACGPSGGDDDGGDPEPVEDTDGDGISDDDEGRPAGTDTDADGDADYLDLDSDGDGLADSLEAGDDDPATAPFDHDHDDLPDFQDLDSDGNGLPDGTGSETADDLDGDGTGNWADTDDDGDFLEDAFEIGGMPQAPLDSDGDDTPDYQDEESDGDGVPDAVEGGADPDDDDVPSYLDDDSDGDCVPDEGEGAGDADGDGAPNIADVDADSDGLGDEREDANCNGVVDPGETSPFEPDTDGDDVSDLVEIAAGSDPTDPADNPQQNGDFVFVVPYQGSPDPDEDDLDFSTALKKVDVYVLMDLSGSMSGEAAAVRDNMATVLRNLTCPPAGDGDPDDCIRELWSGAGTFTYAERNPYVNRLRIQPEPDDVGPAIPAVDNGACSGCAEPHRLAAWATVTGLGYASSGCTGATSFAAAGSCASSPAGAGGIGYPCFRPGALPVILLATDENSQYTCPAAGTVVSRANQIGAKILGILGSSVAAGTREQLETLASGTGAVTSAGEPLVFDGADASASSAIEDAIRSLASNVPLDLSALPVDLGGDPVDAVDAFVDHLETLQLGSASCQDGLADSDSDGDGFDDRYLDVLPGTPVCWRLVPRANTTVPATDEPQLYRARVDVFGDGVTLLDSRDVFFVVPPVLDGPGVD